MHERVNGDDHPWAMEYGTAQIHDITFSNYHRELRVRELTQVAVTVQKAERARYDRLKRIMLAAGTQEFAQDVGREILKS